MRLLRILEVVIEDVVEDVVEDAVEVVVEVIIEVAFSVRGLSFLTSSSIIEVILSHLSSDTCDG